MGQQRKRQERSRETYYREEEVARLIINLVQWNGDGASVRGCAGIWGRIVREFFRSSMPVVTVGVDAGRAKAALERMPVELAEALMTFHISSLGIGEQARVILGISRDTYHRRLMEAHPRFLEEYAEQGRIVARREPVTMTRDHSADLDTDQPIKQRARILRRGGKNA
jgi:DNA-directed RNA polymerase specialized sigma24 family protein